MANISSRMAVTHFYSTLVVPLLPEQNVGFFVSTNAVGGAGVGDAVAHAFADRYFPIEKAADPVPTADF